MSPDIILSADAWYQRRRSEHRQCSHVDEILTRYAEVDRRLVAQGFPATSPWWMSTLERWYRSEKRQCVIRSGRRGGKSSTLSRLGVVEALYGHHDVPPGDTGVVAVVSTRRGEAAERLTTIRSILDALGVAYKPWGEYGVRLADKPIGFRVYTASIAGVSGLTSIFVFCDEVAKWKDGDTGVNPATEVLRSLRPTVATQREARIALSSSPFSIMDAHFDAFEEGETPMQVVAYAPTWEANPSITEADTRELEPDDIIWRREYLAIPQAETERSLFTSHLLDVSTRPGPLVVPRAARRYYAAAIDPATRVNAWTLAVATQDEEKRRIVALTKEWRGSVGKPLSPRDVLKEVAGLVAPYGITQVWTDQWAVDSLRELAQDAKMQLVPEPWTAQSKAETYEELLKYAQSGKLELPPDPVVRSDLLGVLKRVTRNGVVYELLEQRGRHSDYAPAIAMAVSKANVSAGAAVVPLKMRGPYGS